MAEESTACPRPADRLNLKEVEIVSDRVSDRTGELVKAIHETAGDLHRATIARLDEPDTGTSAPIILHTDGSIAPVPQEYFDDYRENPKWRAGTATMTRIESFIDHVNRFKDIRSVIFAKDDPAGPSLTAVIDYHAQGEAHEVAPSFCKHRAHFAFPLSPEWQAWRAHNKKTMSLTDFAEFLEENFVHVEQITDIGVLNEDIQHLVNAIGRDTIASPSKLLELSKGLTINENSQVANHQNLATGEGEIRFKTEHTNSVGEKLNIPRLFIVTIPVFARGDLYRIAARLNYRVREGRVTFSYELWGIERVFEQAFVEACDRAKDETELPLLYGKPEA